MSRFRYLKRDAPKPKPAAPAPPPAGEKLETVFVRRTLYRPVLKALQRTGRDDVGELVEELLAAWVQAQAPKAKPDKPDKKPKKKE